MRAKSARISTFSLVTILVVFGLSPLAHAEDPSEMADLELGPPASDEWRVELTPYFFAPAVDAKSTVSGSTSSLDLSFGDIIDNFGVFGLSGRIEAWKGDWGIFFDGAYLALDGDFTLSTPAPTIGIGVEITDAMLDFGLGYRLLKLPLAEDQSRMLIGDLLGGGRYHYLKQEIELSAVHPILGPVGTTLGGDEEWVELIVGARIKFDIFENFAVLVRGDVGGFGIGSGSDLTWNVVAGVDWRFKENMSLKIGYRILDVDYERHSGASTFGFDGQMKGPIIGLTIIF